MDLDFAQFKRDPVTFALRHSETAPECVRVRPHPAGQMRGLDFYKGKDLVRVYIGALHNFYSYHKRLPDVMTFPKGADHLFAAKFWRYFPVRPCPASKLTPVEFIQDPAVRASLSQPRQQVYADPITLLLEAPDLFGPRFLVKLAKGNNETVRIDLDNDDDPMTKIQSVFNRAKKMRYGVAWGEWLYGIGAQDVFVEEDLAPRMTGFEYMFHWRGGQVRSIRCSNNMVIDKYTNAPAEMETRYYRPADMSEVDGAVVGRKILTGHIPNPDNIALMTAVAQDIGRQFDAVRVDFIELTDGVALGELSLFTGNGHLKTEYDDLENTFVNCFSML